MDFIFYRVVWWTIFLANLALIGVTVASPFGLADQIDSVGDVIALIILGISLAVCNIIVTDISCEFICILAGFFVRKNNKRGIVPAAPSDRREPYLVVYCLKSNHEEDISGVLGNIRKSFDNNDYPNVEFMVLSGTTIVELCEHEEEKISSWNASNSEDGLKVRYIRRRRSILYKYGQYLDFIMLLNGHDGSGPRDTAIALYKDTLPEDGAGCFVDSDDKRYFEGNPCDRLVLMDRDNILGKSFFSKVNDVFHAHSGEVDIVQPEIVEICDEYVEDTKDSLYSILSRCVHGVGVKLQKHRSHFFPVSSFFGKGVISKKGYNKLLGYVHETGSTCEEDRIPRDLVSHDIIEASTLNCVNVSSASIMEDFPKNHYEWHVRQSRWDMGDLILAKYLYPWTYGIVPNMATKFSFSRCSKYYKEFSGTPTVHTSMFNARSTVVKFFAFLAVTMNLVFSENNMVYILFLVVNIEIVLIPMFVLSLTSTSIYSTIGVTLYNIYMGMVDIYYGMFRALWGLVALATCGVSWRPFCNADGNPFVIMTKFLASISVEYMVAIILEVIFGILYVRSDEDTPRYIFFMVWLLFILIHPLMVCLSCFRV